MGKKIRGCPTDAKLESIPEEMFSDKAFLEGISRRVLSRLTAQVYSRTGKCLGPMVTTIKILLSRACELSPGILDIDKSLYNIDEEFTKLCGKILLAMSKYKDIKEFPRALIPKGNILSAIVSFADGGIPAYGANAYILSEKGEVKDTKKHMEMNQDKLKESLDEITTTMEIVNDPLAPRSLEKGMQKMSTAELAVGLERSSRLQTAEQGERSNPDTRTRRNEDRKLCKTSTNNENAEVEQTSRIASSKSKCTKRSVPANETSARALQGDLTKALCACISMRKEYQLMEIPIILLGDSICVSLMFSPNIVLKNTFLRTAIMASKERAREILEMLPKATILFGYCPGPENSADFLSKLFMNPVEAINSKLYREGPDMLKHKKTMKGEVFLKMTANEETFYPLPEKYVKRRAKKMEQLDTAGAEFGNANQEELQNKCISCNVDEDCGVFLTRRQHKEENLKKHEVKGKVPTVDCIEPDPKCKRLKEENESMKGNPILPGNKAIDRKGVSSKAMEKEVNRMKETEEYANTRRNLLKMNHTYTWKDRALDKGTYQKVLNAKFSIQGSMNLTQHILAFTTRLNKRNLMLENGWTNKLREEAWRQLLLCSQEFEPADNIGKGYQIGEIKGVKVAQFRLNMENELLGANYLPIIGNKSQLGQKIMNQSHLNPVYRFLPVHRTINGALAQIERGPYGVLIPGAKKSLENLSLHCKGCNMQRDIYYTTELGRAYTQLGGKKVFANISMDPLGPLSIQPWVGARKPTKKYPVVVKCLDYGAIWITMAESLETSQMTLCLLRLEQRFGAIDTITRDGGSDLLAGNLNPKLLGKEQGRLLGNVKDIQHLPDAQHRNYVERSINIIKRFLREVTGKVKDQSLPTLLHSEWTFLLEKAARVCNEVPFKTDPANLYLCPQDIINPCEGMRNLEHTDSHLHSMNEMVAKVKKYQEVLMEARNLQVYEDLKRLSCKKMTQSRGPEIKAEVGDVVMFSPKNKFDQTAYGRVTKVSPQTIEFCTKDGKTMARPGCLITPLIWGAKE